jgi:acetoin utilization deacetylase AcuC-like enzyme
MRLFYCDHVEIPLPAEHRFPRTKYRQLRDTLLARGLVQPDMLAPSPAASWEQLGQVHTPDYLTAIRDGTLDAAAQRRLGFPWSPALVERSRRSVGGTIAATQWAMEHRYAANLAGGTHHAFADHGEGYCVFSDIAVAFRDLQVTQPRLRGAIVDLDVHQGNGNAAIFENDPSMFTLSLHGRRNFPFRKQRSSLDVELEEGCDDATYLAQLDRVLPRVLQFRPDIVFYIAGADVLAADALGLLDLTLDGITARDSRVLDAVDSQRIPVVMVMGGGYAKLIDRTVEAHVLSYEAITRRASEASHD